MTGPRMTLTSLRVLQVLLNAHDREVYGLEVIRVTGLGSGSVYPILARFEEAGWLASRLEVTSPANEGRPLRRYYRLTALGAEQAQAGTAKAREQLTAPRARGSSLFGEFARPNFPG